MYLQKIQLKFLSQNKGSIGGFIYIKNFETNHKQYCIVEVRWEQCHIQGSGKRENHGVAASRNFELEAGFHREYS